MANRATLTDQHGLAITSDSADAVECYDRTVLGALGFHTDVGEELGRMLQADPDITMGHVLKGSFLLLMGKPALLPGVGEAIEAAETSASDRGATQRECLHIEALRAAAAGELVRAVQIWEQILVDNPLDVLALRFAHTMCLFLGFPAKGRDLSARVMDVWREDLPCYGFVLGIRAFGLQEAGDYAAAEVIGRRAVEINPGDMWAVHSICHVLEEQGRPHEGVEWVKSTAPGWSHCNNSRHHIRWHRTLYSLELEQFDEVLDLYDTKVRGEKSDENMDIANAVSLLWRLNARKVDVGDRWDELAALSESHIDDHVRAFFDSHYFMALAGSGRHAAAQRMLKGLRDFTSERSKTVARITEDVGLQLYEGLHAYCNKDYERAVDLMLPVRYDVEKIGGSRAQRDIFAETLIYTTLRAKRFALARSLLAERTALKPKSPSSWRLLATAHDGLGNKQQARAAETKAAESLLA